MWLPAKEASSHQKPEEARKGSLPEPPELRESCKPLFVVICHSHQRKPGQVLWSKRALGPGAQGAQGTHGVTSR